jgi:hypothetical protein
MFFVAVESIVVVLLVMGIMGILIGVSTIFLLILTEDDDEYEFRTGTFRANANTKDGCGCESCDLHFSDRRERIEIKDMHKLMEYRTEGIWAGG